MRSTLLFSLLTVSLFAEAPAQPTIPAEPIGKKKDLLFEDNFEGAQPDKRWHQVVQTFTVEKGALKGTQTRVQNIPAADGKPAVTAHAAVHGLELPTSDSIVECKFCFEGATMMDIEFDDRKYTGCHYGHICRAQVRFNPKDKSWSAVIIDEKEGNMRNDIYEMKNDPSKKAEVAKLLQGRQATFPIKQGLETGKWYTVVVETIGDEMRLSVDGKAVAYLKSPGIAHATKSKIEFGVAGQSGCFDDLKVWSAAK